MRLSVPVSDPTTSSRAATRDGQCRATKTQQLDGPFAGGWRYMGKRVHTALPGDMTPALTASLQICMTLHAQVPAPWGGGGTADLFGNCRDSDRLAFRGFD